MKTYIGYPDKKTKSLLGERKSDCHFVFDGNVICQMIIRVTVYILKKIKCEPFISG